MSGLTEAMLTIRLGMPSATLEVDSKSSNEHCFVHGVSRAHHPRDDDVLFP